MNTSNFTLDWFVHRYLYWIFEAKINTWARAFNLCVAIIAVQWISFRLGMTTAATSAVAVVIVSQPIVGMFYTKSFNRVVGTLFGAIMSIVLVASFAQAPGLFFALSIAWIAFCTWLSSYVWKPLEYCFQLSGYTLAMVALQAYSQPDTAFLLGFHRFIAITMAVLIIGALTAIIVPVSARKLLQMQAATCIDNNLLLLSNTLSGLLQKDYQKYQKDQLQAITKLFELEKMRISAYVESFSRGYIFNQATLLLQNQLSMVTNLNLLSHAFINYNGECRPDLYATLKGTCADFVNELKVLKKRENYQDYLLELLLEYTQKTSLIVRQVRECIVSCDKVNAELNQLSALAYLTYDSIKLMTNSMLHRDFSKSSLFKKNPEYLRNHFSLHRFTDLSLGRALRPIVSMSIGLLIWYYTAWNYGHIFLMMPYIIPVFFYAFPDPKYFVKEHCKGMLLGLFFAFIFSTFIMPSVDGFILYALLQVPLLMIAGVGLGNPRTLIFCISTLLFFYSAAILTNQPIYNMQAFSENMLAIALGAFIGYFALLFIFPEGKERARCSINKQMFFELAQLSQGELKDYVSYESRMYDRFQLVGLYFAQSSAKLLISRQVIQVLTLGKVIHRYQYSSHAIPEAAQHDCQQIFNKLNLWLRACAKSKRLLLDSKLREDIVVLEKNLQIKLQSIYAEASARKRVSLIRIATLISLIGPLLDRMFSVENQRFNQEIAILKSTLHQKPQEKH